MIEDIIHKAAEQQQIELKAQAEKPPLPELPPVPSQVAPDKIEAADEAFKLQPADPAANAFALWATAPLVAEILRDQFKKDEEEPEKTKNEDEVDR